jgi:hypothetical protein
LSSSGPPCCSMMTALVMGDAPEINNLSDLESCHETEAARVAQVIWPLG